MDLRQQARAYPFELSQVIQGGKRSFPYDGSGEFRRESFYRSEITFGGGIHRNGLGKTIRDFYGHRSNGRTVFPFRCQGLSWG